MKWLTSLKGVAAAVSKAGGSMDRRELMGLATAAAVTTPALCDPAIADTMAADGSLPGDSKEFVPLWPGTPPDGAGIALTLRQQDTVLRDGYHVRSVAMIQTPGLIVYRPAKPNGLSLLIMPGGGYAFENVDLGGRDVAQHYSSIGITCFVLRYRLPAEGWQDRADVPLQDAQRAMRLIRSNAKFYGIDPAKVASIGFSAGGHLSASLATRFSAKVYDPVDASDALNAKPIVVSLLYPVITMQDGTHPGSRNKLLGSTPGAAALDAYSTERHVPADTPPTFICLAADDPEAAPFANGIAMFGALRAAKIPAELHVFEVGGHGFGVHLAEGKPVGAWPDLFLAWAATHGFSA
ncbi:MAG TPA: alpha/beta hydrolase [Rhizomicrobium sp.]|jgi:acetyl esterase/lipase|nr:alpha/beta hydrolase [Rhizomicrobium sp.]